MTRPVRECKRASFQLERIEDRVVGDATDGKECDEIGQRLDAGEKKRTASRDFLGVGLFCGGTQRTAFAIMQSTS
jgi:hypothetical protein